MTQTALITEIQRFSVNDGPGFRTVVFLKGCPLQCAWCHNPETINYAPQLYWKQRRCVQCGACMDACPAGVIQAPIGLSDTSVHAADATSRDIETYHKINREKCNACMRCVDACHYDALCVAGRPMSVEDILQEVEKDRSFYDNSGGGMTVSGGEPTAQAVFSTRLLKTARSRGLHTCLDTNGFCDGDVFEAVAREADIVLFDLKHLDSGMHRIGTGVGNEIIIRNLKHIVSRGNTVWIRIPVIPDFNDTVLLHQRIARFLLNLSGSISRVDLLPYHNWCQDKYDWLGLDWSYEALEATDPASLESLAAVYRCKGLPVTVGGSGFEPSARAIRPELTSRSSASLSSGNGQRG